MTQHGSFPGRPRGRRARSDSDVPEWAGYDAVPQDEREFPDLSPIRDRDARARDARTQGEWMQDARLPEDLGYPQSGPVHPQAGPSQASPSQASPTQVGPTQVGPTQAGPTQAGSTQASLTQTGPRHAVGGQAPWDDQQGSAPPRSAKHASTGSAAAQASHPIAAFSERWRRRGSESRGDRRADRRKRRRLYAIGGGALALVIALCAYFLTSGGGGNPNLAFGSLVTTFLPGELQQVPNACSAVPGASLSQYLPGQLKLAAPPLNNGASSECTWTLDKPPMYRVLEVSMNAYSPSGLAPGDGSATFAAEYAYAETEAAKQKPGPRSGQPKATITDLTGMPGGSDTSAFEATQVFNVNGAVTDVTTVVVRYRNVIVTVVVNGLDHANKGNYGPVSPSELSSAAQTVARQVSGKLVH